MIEFSLTFGGVYGWSSGDYCCVRCVLDFVAMRALRLLVWGLLAFLFTVYAGLASAAAPVNEFSHVSVKGTYPTIDAMCDAWIAWALTSDPKSTRACSPPHSSSRFYYTSSSGGTRNYQQATLKTYCADGGSVDYTKPVDQRCGEVPPPPPDPAEPDPCADKNPIVRRWNYPASGPYSAPGHYSGCVVTPIEMMVCRKEAAGSYCMWMVKRTGDKYSGPDTPGTGGTDAPEVTADPPVKSPPIEAPPTDDPGKGPCPTGTVHAGMSQSGIPMCIGSGSTPPAKPPQPKTETEKNETGADGSTTNTKTVITTNSDGSTTKTVTVTVTKADGTKETSGTASTSTTPSGVAGKTDRGPEDDKYDLCKTNPNLSICREGSVTGTCGQIQCVGDAIQCATLRAAAAMECRGKADEDALKASPQTALGNSILSGADPMKAQIDTAMKGTEVDLSKPGLDDTGFIGGGSCLPNKTMSVMGRSVTVEFAQLCTNIQPLRGVVMACAFILAYMIVSRSVLQG